MSDLYVRDSHGVYTFSRDATGDEIIALAERILSRRFRKGAALGSPGDTARYLQCKLSNYELEVFCCLFLDTRNRVIAFEEMFYGTIDGATVHPREIVKRGTAPQRCRTHRRAQPSIRCYRALAGRSCSHQEAA